MSLFGRREHEMPGLNTSSLPDLIFTVLFFFMIVTHMRQVTLKVAYQAPQGKQLTRLTKKSAVSYIYIGQPVSGMAGSAVANDSSRVCVQLNDKLATPAEVMDYVLAEKQRMGVEDQRQMTISIRADRHVPMGVVMDVKQALRQAKVFRVNYSAVEMGK